MTGVPRSLSEASASLLLLSILRAQGWHRTLKQRSPVDATGRPQPWLTYGAVAWLDRVLAPPVRVFEFGVGGSTAWLAPRVGEIISVEHDREWIGRIQRPSNGKVIHRPCEGTWWEMDENAAYVRTIADGAPWDVVIVDGMGRNTCARAAVDHITASGIIVVDDTDKADSLPAQNVLTRGGHGRIDFWGFRAGVTGRGCTTVFSRDFNTWLGAAIPSDLTKTRSESMVDIQQQPRLGAS